MPETLPAEATDLDQMRPLPRKSLRGVEKIAVPIMETINGTHWLKSLIHGSLGQFNRMWMAWATRNLWELHDVERVLNIDAPRGVILVSNHRSFFDMYIFGSMLTERTELMKRLFFPVRKVFFYDSLLGIVTNLALSGGSMWPPIFKGERRDLNPLALKQLACVLRPGNVIGIHPEGTRGKGPDPWELQATKPGLGRMVQAVHPDTVVLPFFILGLGNDFFAQCRRNFNKPGERGEPVRMWVAETFTAGELQAMGDARLITDVVMARIKELADKDRAQRADNPVVR